MRTAHSRAARDERADSRDDAVDARVRGRRLAAEHRSKRSRTRDAKTDVDRVRDGGIIRVVCLNFGFEPERRERALSASGSGGRARANGEECVDAARRREARESEDEGAGGEGRGARDDARRARRARRKTTTTRR